MRIDEILGFASKTPKRTTIKKKVRRAAAAKGDKDAYTHNFKKASN